MAIYKGWNAKILWREPSGTGAYIEMGCAESVSVEVATGVEPYYCIGSRTPETLVEGNIEITGSLSRAWVNTEYLGWLGISQTGFAAKTFDLVFKAKDVSGAPWIYLYGCKFETGSIDIPQDGFLTEDYDFRAKDIGIVPA